MPAQLRISPTGTNRAYVFHQALISPSPSQNILSRCPSRQPLAWPSSVYFESIQKKCKFRVVRLARIVLFRLHRIHRIRILSISRRRNQSRAPVCGDKCLYRVSPSWHCVVYLKSCFIIRNPASSPGHRITPITSSQNNELLRGTASFMNESKVRCS